MPKQVKEPSTKYLPSSYVQRSTRRVEAGSAKTPFALHIFQVVVRDDGPHKVRLNGDVKVLALMKVDALRARGLALTSESKEIIIYSAGAMSPKFNLQPRGSDAKAYQLKQIRTVVVKYRLWRAECCSNMK